MAPRFVDKEEKKKNILLAAQKVFARKGFTSAKIDDVAREARIGKGTVYEYFKSKEDIFFALYEEVKAELHRRIFSIDKELPPGEKLRKYLASALLSFEAWRDFSFVLLDFWAVHKRSSSSKVNFDELYSEAREQIASVIKEGIKNGDFKKVNPTHAASLLVGIIDGLLLQWIFNPKSFSLQRISDDIVEIISTGIRKHDR